MEDDTASNVNSSEWEEESQLKCKCNFEDLYYDPECEAHCPYTPDELKDMEREKHAGMCDPEAWGMYLEAEKRGFNPTIAVDRWYAGEPQEWEKRCEKNVGSK